MPYVTFKQVHFNSLQISRPMTNNYTHMSKQNDKPTMPNALTIVEVWNSCTISLYLNGLLMCVQQMQNGSNPCRKGGNNNYRKSSALCHFLTGSF